MASRYYGVPRGGDNKTDVTEAASTNSKDIELVVDLTNSPSREQVLKAIEALKAYILNGNWPPA